MSHPLVAAVWEQLGRHDVANILREIIGEHAAELAMIQVRNGPASEIESMTRKVFWIKAIFDLQRTYLQGMASMRDCHPYLLPYLLSSESILSTLMYLIRVKSDLFPISTATTRELAEHRYSIAQTLLAGVRVLLLRGEPLPTQTKFNLSQALRAAWQHPGLSNGESHLVNDLIPQAMDFVGYPDFPSSPRFSMVKACLPSFVSGIYPLTITPDNLITDTLTAMVGPDGDQLAPFWSLYDILWAAEAALIQCHVDRRRMSQEQGYTSEAVSKVDEAFGLAEETRKQLARTILVASDGKSDSPCLQLLATTILSQNADGGPPLQTRRVREAWSQFSNIRTAVDNSLGHFVRWLINRRVQLWDCNGELEAVSREYQQHLTHWLHSSSPDSGHPSHSTVRRGSVVYVVNCPSVHPVPKSLLEDQLRSCDKAVYEEIQENPHFLTLDTFCPMCPGDTRIQHARMIEPLEQLSNTLNGVSESESTLSRHSAPGLSSRRTESRSSSLSHSTSHSSAVFESSESSASPTSPVAPSPGLLKLASLQSISAVSESFSTVVLNTPSSQFREKPHIRTLSKDLINAKLPFVGRGSSFRKSSSKDHRLPRQSRFAFSTTGKTLLLWGPDSSWVMRFEILPNIDGKKPPRQRYDVSGVQCAAVGDQRCAVLASVGEHFELLTFEKNGLTAEAYLTIDSPRQAFSKFCITMSRDDEYVAFTLGDYVHIYHVGTKAIRKVPLANQTGAYHIEGAQTNPMTPLSLSDAGQDDKIQSALVERKLQFSIDGKKLIVSSQLADQHIHVDVWDCAVEPWRMVSENSRILKLPPWNVNDGDITSVFYDEVHRSIFLTAFQGVECPIFFSTINDDMKSTPVSIRTVHAAQSPSGSRFAIANGKNELYTCDFTNNTLDPSRMKKATSKLSSSIFKPGQMALAFPLESMILMFWAKDGKLILRTIRGHDSNETVSDYDLRADFDRLMLERPSITGSQLQPKRQSFLLNHPIPEMGSTPFIPRPDLPELASGE